jgi:hypothetical protein
MSYIKKRNSFPFIPIDEKQNTNDTTLSQKLRARTWEVISLLSCKWKAFKD